MINKLRYFIKYKLNPAKWVPATILCLKFPFLYPRNNFTGKHYTNWTLDTKQNRAYIKAYKVVGEVEDGENPLHEVLVNRFQAFLVWFYGFLEKLIGVFHIIPWYTRLDSMPKGWKKAFGVQLCKEIKQALLDNGGRKALKNYCILDIKEKYGVLHWYDANGNREIDKIIEKYEYISQHTCIVCGKGADYLTEGWIEPYCEKHLPERYDKDNKLQVKKYGTKDLPWYGYHEIF